MSGRKVFFDTNLFIYLIEENEKYLDSLMKMLNFLEENRYEIVTSTLTLGEILTKPYKDNKINLANQYIDFFNKIELIELNQDIATKFAKIRADYAIKTPDAIQLASSVYAKCKYFATNDERLRTFKDCEILLLSDF